MRLTQDGMVGGPSLRQPRSCFQSDSLWREQASARIQMAPLVLTIKVTFSRSVPFSGVTNLCELVLARSRDSQGHR